LRTTETIVEGNSESRIRNASSSSTEADGRSECDLPSRVNEARPADPTVKQKAGCVIWELSVHQIPEARV